MLIKFNEDYGVTFWDVTSSWVAAVYVYTVSAKPIQSVSAYLL